jgi:peptidyl-prolyl cis-trans isomerase SurA
MITMILFGNNKVILILIITIFSILTFDNSHSLENKIKLKVNNEIITSLDIINEISYLKAFNKSFKDIDSKKALSISVSSLTTQKIKKLEILNFIKKIEVDKKYKDQLIKATYSKMGLKNYKDFLEYIKDNNGDIKNIENKISKDVLWKQLIFSKFSNKIKIDEDKLKNKISKNINKKIKSYLLSEIVFVAANNNELNLKFNDIKNSISEIGFENTVLTYSIADSSKGGGKIGWITENSLNNKIKNNLNKIKIGGMTNPIVMPGSFMILKIEDIKLEERNIDTAKELKILIGIERNKQLNQYSNIYFNKIKKDYQIDEL